MISQFGRAQHGLELWRRRAGAPEVRWCADLSLAALRAGHRFALPEELPTVERRHLPDELRAGMKLPFEPTCVLFRHPAMARGSGYWLGTFFTPISDWAQDQTLLGSNIQRADFCSTLAFDAGPQWVSLPMIGGLQWLDVGPRDFLITASTSESLMADGIQDSVPGAARMFADAFRRLIALLAMLTLHNVRSVRVERPQRRHGRAKKRQLFDYHVLEVDGVRWLPGASAGSGEDGAGRRAHLRRGHIRRLGDGRHVWVRATYVHGAADGFVAKDYQIAPALAARNLS